MNQCKLGGCSSIGCEGGRYCYESDGKPREATAEQRERLSALGQALSGAPVLAAGFDVATDRFEIEVAGWGREAE